MKMIAPVVLLASLEIPAGDRSEVVKKIAWEVTNHLNGWWRDTNHFVEELKTVSSKVLHHVIEVVRGYMERWNVECQKNKNGVQTEHGGYKLVDEVLAYLYQLHVLDLQVA